MNVIEQTKKPPEPTLPVELLKSIRFEERNLNNKDGDYRPCTRIVAGLNFSASVMVSNDGIQRLDDNIKDEARKYLIAAIHFKLYGKIVHEWPPLRHEIMFALDPMKYHTGIQDKMDAFYDLFRRP